uniref:Mediator of RNA polymerase II transcription subunit 19 n=1 Tax=Rhabditophanes sp. KR3021 TaxID=114890 RepID=A0AC35UBW4_9BILA
MISNDDKKTIILTKPKRVRKLKQTILDIPTFDKKLNTFDTNLKKCICPYSSKHTLQKVISLFSDKPKIELMDDNANKEFWSSNPLMEMTKYSHLDQLSRDLERMRLRFKGDGDLIVHTASGVLYWDRKIVEIRTIGLVKKDEDSIDLSTYSKEAVLAFETYIYSADLRHCSIYMEDLLKLATKYGPNQLRVYLEKDNVLSNEDVSKFTYSRSEHPQNKEYGEAPKKIICKETSFDETQLDYNSFYFENDTMM